ncbi:hypothetical protein tb265_44150 [Gemmatimonadetes bacterium T265]|nr:hypothetical protein tb265_44150 [Gemmatimonadetes bacterium T265]
MACLAAAAGCVDAPVAPVPPAARPLLAQVTGGVIVPAFDSVVVRAARLAVVLDSLAAAPSAARVAAAQAAWVDARRAWELTEAFGFGPAHTGGFDGRLDTWPLDLAGLGAFLAGATPVTPDNVALLDPTLAGFHGIEAVIFGALDTPVDGSGSADVVAAARAPAAVAAGLAAAGAGPRRLAYVALAGHALAATAAGLRDAWAPGAGDYAGQLAGAGQGTSVYATLGAGVREVVGGITDPCDEVATSKIARPLSASGADAVRYQESRFSDNTLADLEDDIASARALYLGVGVETALALAPDALPAGAAAGVRALVLATQPGLDAEVRADFAGALAALAAVGPSFGTALTARRDAVVAAQRAVLRLRDVLVTRVAPLVGAVADAD